MGKRRRLPTQQQQRHLTLEDLETLYKYAGTEAPFSWFLVVCSVAFVALLLRPMVEALIPSWANVVWGVVGGIALGFVFTHYFKKMHARGSVYILLWMERIHGINGSTTLDQIADDISESRRAAKL